MNESDSPIVLYDGVCNVCDASVQFILDHDPEEQFRFASLQSDVGQALASSAGIDASDLSTLVLLVDGKGYVRSDAALRIARRLEYPWSAAYALHVVPRPVRDLAYRIVSMNRIHWFGSRATCRIPTPDIRRRFLDV